MVKIKVSDLKRFFASARNITGGTIISILDYLLVDCSGDTSTFTKSNLGSFIQYEMPAEFESAQTFLIEEKILSELLKSCDGEFLTISFNGALTVLSEGKKAYSFDASKISIKEFPKTPDLAGNKEKFTLSSAILNSIKNASVISYKKEKISNPSYEYVHLFENGDIICQNAFLAYTDNVSVKLPDISISNEACKCICELSEVNYFFTENYNVFSLGSITYGFVKEDVSKPAIRTHLNDLRLSGGVLFDVPEIVSFCESSERIFSAQPFAKFIIIDNAPSLCFEAAERNIYNKAELSTSNIDDIPFFSGEPFEFAIQRMLIVLKSANSDKIKISTAPSPQGYNYIFHNENSEYIGLLAGVKTLKN